MLASCRRMFDDDSSGLLVCDRWVRMRYDQRGRRDSVVEVGDGPNLAGRLATFLNDASTQAIEIADLAAPLRSSRYLVLMRRRRDVS